MHALSSNDPQSRSEQFLQTVPLFAGLSEAELSALAGNFGVREFARADLATLVGARRKWSNCILYDWHKQGLIECKSGKIITRMGVHFLGPARPGSDVREPSAE